MSRPSFPFWTFLLVFVPAFAEAQPRSREPDATLVLSALTPIYEHSFMQPQDNALPSHVIVLASIAPAVRSAPFPVGSYAMPSGDFRPAQVHVGARRTRASVFTVVDGARATVVEAREVWQMGWERNGRTTWHDVVPLIGVRPPDRAIVLRGRHAGLRLLRVETSAGGIVGSADLATCLGPSSSVARRFGIARGPVHVACYERGLTTVHGEGWRSSVVSNGQTIWRTHRPFYLLVTPSGVQTLVEERRGRWRLLPLPRGSDQ
jgi:hypothetical protein